MGSSGLSGISGTYGGIFDYNMSLQKLLNALCYTHNYVLLLYNLNLEESIPILARNVEVSVFGVIGHAIEGLGLGIIL